MIYAKLEQYDYAGATAVAVVMLLISFALLLLINGLQAWSRRRQNGGRPAPAQGRDDDAAGASRSLTAAGDF